MADKDYYKLLGVSKNATEDEIKKVYRRLALRYHPDKNRAPGAADRFKEVTEAYTVLRDKKTREEYDRRVEDCRKARSAAAHRGSNVQRAEPYASNSCGRPKPGFKESFSFGEDLFRTFHFDTAPKDRDIRHDLALTLEEVLRGCVKNMKVTRTVTAPDGSSQYREQKILTINVKPGWKAGTKIRFEREGDRLPGRVPADIVFVARDKPHRLFKRNGVDVHYVAKITLTDSLRGVEISVPTLTGGVVPLSLKGPIYPSAIKPIRNEGLPHPKDPTKRGDLLVNFEIIYPDSAK
ncbi:dnaJ protein homolog 1-like [Dermacentor albipictus]|uniref:dnaJ protein homolog 1-like n=1 Tax=Dermacentor albipictus TaxID=60249 RepID=UPI0031FD1777